jgi:hypothetical protein
VAPLVCECREAQAAQVAGRRLRGAAIVVIGAFARVASGNGCLRRGLVGDLICLVFEREGRQQLRREIEDWDASATAPPGSGLDVPYSGRCSRCSPLCTCAMFFAHAMKGCAAHTSNHDFLGGGGGGGRRAAI